MCDKKNSVFFINTECLVLSPEFKLPDESQVLLRVPRENNMYNVNLKNIVPSGDLTCLSAKATINESNLWHRRLGHINFKTMNNLVTCNLVRGLLTKVFENDNTCVSCKKGKQHRSSCKTKPVSFIDQPLYRLHMDLFRTTFVKSLNKKSYCLVVIDDYSREFSVPRTPQQNGIAERKNRTLIEAARTMLADSLLPILFWAEEVNTACYVQNRVLVTKPHNKTHYELLHGRTPSIGFMRPFGCPVTIFNTIDSLGKFDRKVDEGFLVGYSSSSKAFKVFNSRIRIIQETLQVKFLENKPNVAGSGPTCSVQSKKQDGKIKREAKGKSPVEFLTGYRNLSAEFEDFSDTKIELEDITYFDDEVDLGAETDFNNLETSITVIMWYRGFGLEFCLVDLKMILEPSDANREITVTETFHLQIDDELSDKELKQIEADDQAIQTILFGLPEDIYAAIDSCETAQEIWLRKEVDELKAERLAKTQDPLALMTNFNNPYVFPAPHQDQPSFNQNYLQQPMTNPEDITDPITVMNMALALMNAGNLAGYNDAIGHQNQIGNGNLVAARAEGNATGPRRRDAAYLQTQLLISQKEEQASTSGIQTDSSPIYDTDGLAEVHENCDDNEISNMFTQEGQYTELLEPIPKSHQVPQNDYDGISEDTSMEQGGETVEHHL
nr:hypothetical protein [Tanacetum cinerariifolium]